MEPDLGPRTPADAEWTAASAPVGRRVVLGLLGLGVVGVVTGARIQGFLERSVGPIVAKDGTGLASLLPFGRFRLYTVTGGFPNRRPEDYTLRVHGLVEHPVELTHADLLAMEPTAITRDFQCVTGWRVEDVRWRGVRLSDVLALAGVRAEARAIRFWSFDGEYTESLTLEQAARPDVLVAYELEGSPLSRQHGGPARLYVAPMYGYKSLKWLEAIELTDKVVPGYWEVRGYDTDAWVGESNGRDDEAT